MKNLQGLSLLFLVSLLLFFFAFAHAESDDQQLQDHVAEDEEAAAVGRRPRPISCREVNSQAVSCVDFASGKVQRPTQTCCNGLQQLAWRANTVANRRAICRCIQQGAKNFLGVQDKYMTRIPASCNVNVGFTVSLKTNCNAIL